MRKYETIFVVDSLLKSEEIDSIINKYERFISANGGKIETIDRWGKKRLAYEIKKRQYGYYVLIRFDGPPTMIKQLEREYRLNEALLRYKTIKLSTAALHSLETEAQAQAEKESEAPEKEEKQQPESKTEKNTEEEPETASAESETEESDEQNETAEEEKKESSAE